jgi:hypothetical protein
MRAMTKRERHIAEARGRRRRFRRDDRIQAKAKRKAPPVDDPLFDAFKDITDTRHIFTFLASPFVADRNKPVSLYVAKRVREAVKLNYSDLFYASLTSVYHYMLYQDFCEYLRNVCGVTPKKSNIKHYFHAVYFPRFQNTEVYTRLWPKLGQHLPELDGMPSDDATE